MVTIKSENEIALMKKAGEILAGALELIEQNIRPGVTTEKLDKLAEKYIKKNDAKPSFKGYSGYPASICASINEEVVHGIPGKRRLNEGDIIGIDIGVCYAGYHADAARTYGVGKISDEAKHLIEVTRESFFKGIAKLREGVRLGDVSYAIQTFVEENGYSVVRDLVGHGIGSSLHEEPDVPNYGIADKGLRLKQGMTLAIEPMVNLGTYEIEVLDDDWTCVTADGMLSAHYENTVVVTKDGCEIITMR